MQNTPSYVGPLIADRRTRILVTGKLISSLARFQRLAIPLADPFNGGSISLAK